MNMMTPQPDVFDLYSSLFESRKQTEMSLRDYLTLCRETPTTFANAAERMLTAIGEPEVVDTSTDARLGRIFMNRSIKRYPKFSDFFGMEETIERIVGFFKHAAQGLEERKQILYLLGPVGGGKSSLAERLKTLMEELPIYALKAGDQISPVFESPLGLFDPERLGPLLDDRYGIPRRYLTGLMSPWAVKRVGEFDGDISRFTVVRLTPSKLNQICVAKTEPGDDNNQDISSLVGKVDIRKLEFFGQNDADAYAYSGGLNLTTQGLLEFVEMFKAPIKMLHPLLTATQEGNYVGTESIGAIPYQGVVLAHSNESEWQSFKNNKNNEAMIDRICVVNVPYCLRTNEETAIYTKLLQSSDLAESPCAPATLDMLSKFCVLSRLKEHENSNLFSKMRVYNGENLKDVDPKAKSMQEYRDMAGMDEGMNGGLDPLRLQDPGRDLQLRQRGGRRGPGAPDVCAGAVDPPRPLPGGDREGLHRVHQDRAGGPLRRIHRQRDPEGLPGKLRRLRPEPVRPLRRLRRRLGRGPGLQGLRHRRAVRPQDARPGAVQDREAGRASPTRRTSATRW
ncbi:MAG: PrkA family serine protein kinase [Caulobacteraceae bacterium]